MSVYTPNTGGAYLTTSFTGDAGQNMTMMGWALIGTPNPVNFRNFFAAVPGWDVGTEADGVTVHIASPGFAGATGPVLAPNVWYHVAATIYCIGGANNNRVMNLFINGEQAINSVQVNAINPYTAFQVGQGVSAYPMVGNVRDMRIFLETLPPQAVVREMQSAHPIYPHLWAWSTFDTDLYTDKSGNGHLWTQNTAGAQSIQAAPLQSWPGRGMQFIR